MPPHAFGRSGAYSVSPWCYVRTCVRAYVTFVTRFKFPASLGANLRPAFLLQLITSGLESWNFVWHLPTSRPFNVWYRCPRVVPLDGARVRAGASVYCGHISSFFNLGVGVGVRVGDREVGGEGWGGGGEVGGEGWDGVGVGERGQVRHQLHPAEV